MPFSIIFKLSVAEERCNHRARAFSQYPSVSTLFNRHYESPQNADRIEITQIVSKSETVVYAGKLIGESYEKDVVLKIPETVERAEAEALRYKDMKGLQGSIIPRFYGLFRAKRWCGGYLVGIVLERFGTPIDKSLVDLERNIKTHILSYVDKIHKAGFAIDDFGPGNVLFDGSNNDIDIRIIDFAHAVPHECRSTYDYPNALEVAADSDELSPAWKCWDLYSLASEMGFWTIPSVVINGFPYEAKGMPTDIEIRLLNPERFFSAYNGYQLITLLEVYYRNVQKQLESGKSTEDLQHNIDQMMREAEEEWIDKTRTA